MGRSALCIALSALHVHGIDQLCGTTMSTTCTIAKRKIIDRASNDGSVRAVRFKTSSSLRLFECGKGEGGFFPPSNPNCTWLCRAGVQHPCLVLCPSGLVSSKVSFWERVSVSAVRSKCWKGGVLYRMPVRG